LFFIGFLYRRKIANACASKKQTDNFEETNTKNPLSNFDKLDEDERTAVLEHIQTVCKNVPKIWHILTDIDDTIKVSSTGGTNVKYQITQFIQVLFLFMKK
jgi:hypothetical protein